MRQSPALPFKDSFYVGIRLLLMKFKLIRGNQKPPIRLQIDFLVICRPRYRAVGFTGSGPPGRGRGASTHTAPSPRPGDKWERLRTPCRLRRGLPTARVWQSGPTTAAAARQLSVQLRLSPGASSVEPTVISRSAVMIR